MRHACSALCNEGGVQAVRLWHAGTVAAKALWGPAPGEPGVPSDGTPVSAGCKGGCHGHAGHGGQACERKKPHEDLHQAPAAAAQSAIAIRASDFSDHSAVSACAGCTHAMQLCCKALVAFTCEVAGARCTVPGGRWALPVRVSRRSTPRHGALPSRHVATGGPTAYQVHNFERLSRPFHRASLPRRKASEVIPCLATTKEMDMCQPPACTSAFSTRCRSREETFRPTPLMASVQMLLGQSSKRSVSPASETWNDARGPAWAPAAHNRLSTPATHSEALNASAKWSCLRCERGRSEAGIPSASLAGCGSCTWCDHPDSESAASEGGKLYMAHQTAGAGSWLVAQGRQAARATTPTPHRRRAKAKSRPRLQGIKRCPAH